MQNNRPAEVARGLVLELDFSSPAAIARQGGVITGTLQFDREKGAYFDGTNDYITYPMRTQLFNNPGNITAVWEFYPDYDQTTTFYFFGCPGSAGSFGRMIANDSLRWYHGAASTVASVSAATIAANWRQYQRNILVMTSRTGSSQMFLNGVQVGTSVGAWVAQNETTITIGYNSVAPASKFRGWIKSIKYFKHPATTELFTLQESLDLYTQATFRYQERASAILPFSAATHDATNNCTLDVSGKGSHLPSEME